MNSFFRLFSSSCLGTIAAFFILIAIIAISIPILNMGQNDIAKGSVLEITFPGPIPEKTNNVAKSPFDVSQKNSLGLRRIIALIQNAKTDPNISGIVLNGNSVPAGASTLLSLNNVLEEFRSDDKFIYAYGDSYTLSSYFLASNADSIFLNPNGIVELNGLGIMIPFYKALFDRLGVKMEVFYAGEFKSATESYRRTEMSPANKHQTTEYLNDLFETYQSRIIQNRNISETTFVEYVGSLNQKTTGTALAIGLVDKITYQDGFENALLNRLELDSDADMNMISLQEYSEKTAIKKDKKSDEKIALVTMEGVIYHNSTERGVISEDPYFDIFRDLQKEEGLKAVILRVNSPGGDANASDALWHEIDVLKQKGIKVIASYGDYAASGGYYISCHADTIVSMPNTLTGSIGVYSTMPNIQKFVNDKLNIQFDTVATHPYAIGPTPMATMSDEEKAYMQADTDRTYLQFLTRVAEGRGMDISAVKPIAAGRVWSGKQALEVGLVDVIGDLDDAFSIAQEMTGIDEYSILEYPKIVLSPFDALVHSFQNQTSIHPMENLQSGFELLEDAKKLKQIIGAKGVQARLPFLIFN